MGLSSGARVAEATDDLARQRSKRAARALERPIPGFGQMNLRVLLGQVLVGIEEHGSSFDVEQFLFDQGHSQQTIETVVRSLHITEETHPSGAIRPLGDMT